MRYLNILAFPNRVISTLILNLVYSSFFINLSTDNILLVTIKLVINFFILYLLRMIVDKLVRSFYHPSFFNQDRLTIQDVITKNTTSQGPGMPIYTNKDYQLRYQFEVNLIGTIFTMIGYFFFLGFISWIKIFMLLHPKYNILSIDYSKAFMAFAIFALYLMTILWAGLLSYTIKHSIKYYNYLYVSLTAISVIGLIFLLIKLYFVPVILK